MKEISIFIPNNINYIIINNKYLYIYSHTYDYFLILNILNIDIYINSSTNTINIKSKKNKINLFENEISKFIFSLESFFFKKIKFTGKGFKLKKKKNNLFLFFNRAHKCFFININNIMLRLSKNKIILIKNNERDLVTDSKIITNIRNNNIFTKRGLRLTRQIILKKKGKTASS